MDLKIFGIAVSLIGVASGVVYYEASVPHVNAVEVRSPRLCIDALKKVVALNADEKKELKYLSQGIFPSPNSEDTALVDTNYDVSQVTQVSSGARFACSGVVYKNTRLIYNGQPIDGASRSKSYSYPGLLFDARGNVIRTDANTNPPIGFAKLLNKEAHQ